MLCSNQQHQSFEPSQVRGLQIIQQKLKMFANIIKKQMPGILCHKHYATIDTFTFIIEISRLEMIQTFLDQQTKIFKAALSFNPKLDKLNFTPSLWTLVKEESLSRKLDLKIRNSSQVYLQQQQLTTVANSYLKPQLDKIGQQLIDPGLQWRLLKYQNGHFVEHRDYYRQLDPYIHYGTQIWLPPKTICSYQGGVLITKDKTKREIINDQTEWILVILPLGVLHEITKVRGERISLVKPIYIKKKREEYYIPDIKGMNKEQVYGFLQSLENQEQQEKPETDQTDRPYIARKTRKPLKRKEPQPRFPRMRGVVD